MQRDFGWMVEVKKPMFVSQSMLAHCKNEHDAILLTWNERTVKRTMTSAAETLGMPKSHLSNILAGKKYLPNDLRLPFMFLCGNLALRQWEDLQLSKFNLDLELMEAERKVEELKMKRAA